MAGERLEGDTVKGLWLAHARAGTLRNSVGWRSVRSKEWKKHHVHDDSCLYAACCLTGNDLTGIGETTEKTGEVWTSGV